MDRTKEARGREFGNLLHKGLKEPGEEKCGASKMVGLGRS